MAIALSVLGFLCAIAAWWWFVARNRPKYPPLDIADDDPRMIAAVEEARRSLGRFRELLDGDYQEAQVKVPFHSNSGTVEHLWAELLELGDSVVSVRYLTPPVTHSGSLDRLHDHRVEDIEDWVVVLESGAIHGGYTQRVMFAIAREQYGELPRELSEQEGRYVA